MPRNRPRRPIAVEEDADPITVALRRLHDKVAAEPIPDDLLKLLDEMDAKSGKN